MKHAEKHLLTSACKFPFSVSSVDANDIMHAPKIFKLLNLLPLIHVIHKFEVFILSVHK